MLVFTLLEIILGCQWAGGTGVRSSSVCLCMQSPQSHRRLVSGWVVKRGKTHISSISSEWWQTAWKFLMCKEAPHMQLFEGNNLEVERLDVGAVLWSWLQLPVNACQLWSHQKATRLLLISLIAEQTHKQRTVLPGLPLPRSPLHQARCTCLLGNRCTLPCTQKSYPLCLCRTTSQVPAERKKRRFYSRRALLVTELKQEKSLTYSHKCVFQRKRKDTAAKDLGKFSCLQFMNLSRHITEELWVLF